MRGARCTANSVSQLGLILPHGVPTSIGLMCGHPIICRTTHYVPKQLNQSGSFTAIFGSVEDSPTPPASFRASSRGHHATLLFCLSKCTVCRHYLDIVRKSYSKPSCYNQSLANQRLLKICDKLGTFLFSLETIFRVTKYT
jgi:hypothetical protein